MTKYGTIESEYQGDSCGGCDEHDYVVCYVESEFESEDELREHYSRRGYTLVELKEDSADEEHSEEEVEMLSDLEQPAKFLTAVIESCGNRQSESLVVFG